MAPYDEDLKKIGAYKVLKLQRRGTSYNYSYGRIGGLRHAPPLAEAQHEWSQKYRGESKKSHTKT